jgi:predicted nucleic acid-binding protein
LQIVSTADMLAPDLINAEVLSALRRLERLGSITPDRAAQAVSDLADAPIRRIPTLPLVPHIWGLRPNVSAYDACYLSLAQAFNCSVVTVDARLGRLPQTGIHVIVA